MSPIMHALGETAREWDDMVFQPLSQLNLKKACESNLMGRARSLGQKLIEVKKEYLCRSILVNRLRARASTNDF